MLYERDNPMELLPEQSFTPEETAKILRISKATLYREVSRGKLRPTGSRRLMRFTLREIQRYQSGGLS